MTSQSQMRALLQTAAPRLSRHFFASKPCPNSFVSRSLPHQQSHTHASPQIRKQTPFLKAFRSQSTATSSSSKPVISSLQHAIPKRIRGFRLPSSASPAQRSGYFPKTTNSVVAYWLLGSAAGVFGLVVFGGLTRLTESGYQCIPIILPINSDG